MSTLGIEKGMEALCPNNEMVQPGLDGERDALLENVAVLKRMIQQFIPKTVQAYVRMNEFFERKPIQPRKMEQL